jgi:hypothetical protein
VHLAQHMHLARELPVTVVHAHRLIVHALPLALVPSEEVRVVAHLEQRGERGEGVCLAREHLDTQGCSLDTQGCSLDTQGCSLDTQGCSLDTQGCSLDTQGCRA